MPRTEAAAAAASDAEPRVLAPREWQVVEGGEYKWDWMSKALLFSVFLPFILTTRTRIEAAIGVIIFDSAIPDLIAGGFIFAVVANGARRILAMSR